MRMAWMIAGFSFCLWAGLAPAEDLTHSATVEVSRTHQGWIEEAKSHWQRREWDLALERIQSLLDAERSLISLDEHRYQSTQSAARRMLESLPAEALARYEDKFGGAAREKLIAALRDQDFATVRQVSEQYPMTKAGYDALRTLAAALFDRGEHLAASAAYRSISEHAFTRRNMPTADAARWVVALSRLGLTEEAGQVLHRHGEELKNLEVIEKLVSVRSEPRLPPALPSSVVLWERATTLPDSSQRLLDAMSKELGQRGFSPLANFSPLAVGELIIARNPAGVTAYHRDTGKIRWQTPTPSHTVELADNRHMMLNPKLRETLSGKLAALAFADRNAGQLTTDGSRVFLALTDHAPNPSSSVSPGQLLALDAATGEELWRLPEVLQRDAPQIGRYNPLMDPLLGGPDLDLFFFGPPTPLGDKLLVIMEQNRELQLFALSAKTGSVQWTVPLPTTEWPVSKDQRRRRLACPVVYHGGLLLCPTGAGALAAVDPLSRRCLWVYRYAREDLANLPQPLPLPGATDSPRVRDSWWTGARDVCLFVHQGTVLLQSPESRALHAVSLRSGTRLWTMPLDEGLMLTEAANGRALLIGTHSVRFVNIEQGRIEKTLPIPKPGGRGVRVSDSDGLYYLLPLEASGVLRIDLAGQTAWRTFPKSSKPWGNLLRDGAAILMQTHETISRLAPLKLNPSPPENAEERLAWAKLQREAGQFRDAVQVLKDSTDQESLHVLRETLLWELKAHPERAGEIAWELSPLLSSTEHRLRGFRALAEALQRSGEKQASLKHWLKFLDENPAGLVEDPADPAHKIEVSRDVQGAIWDLLRAAEPQEKALLESRLKTHQEEMLRRRDPFAVSRYARTFGQLKWGRELILDDNRRTGIGQSQVERRMELLAISEETDDPRIKASAIKRLAQEHLSALEFREAAFFLRQLQSRFGDLTFPDGQSVSEFIEALPKDSPVRKHLKGDDDPWPMTKPKITEERRAGKVPKLVSIPIHREPGSLCAQLDVWLEPDRQRLHFSGADQTGMWELALPGPKPPVIEESFVKGFGVGPILIFQYHTVLYGIAPIDDHGEARPRVLWQVRMLESGEDRIQTSGEFRFQRREPPQGFGIPYGVLLDGFHQPTAQVGPVSAGVLIYQSGGKLVALAPATGQILWTRSELPEEAKITGDSRHVLVIQPDASQVAALRTFDGREVASRKLPEAGRLLAWWGRRALFQDETKDRMTFSLWDAVTGDVLWKREAPAKSLAFHGDSKRWGVITPDGELRFLDCETGQEIATTELPMVQNPTEVHVSLDESRVFLAVTHPESPGMQWQRVPIANDTSARHPMVQGTLHAFERETGSALWHTAIWHPLLVNTACKNWVFPLEQPVTGPMLILNYRTNFGHVPSTPYIAAPHAMLHCLDKRTGKVLHSVDSDEISEHPRWSMDPLKHEFEIKAYKTTVRFRYEPKIE